MNLDHTLVAALVAGLVSVAVGVISYLSNRSTVRHEVRQTQFKDVLAKLNSLGQYIFELGLPHLMAYRGSVRQVRDDTDCHRDQTSYQGCNKCVIEIHQLPPISEAGFINSLTQRSRL